MTSKFSYPTSGYPRAIRKAQKSPDLAKMSSVSGRQNSATSPCPDGDIFQATNVAARVNLLPILQRWLPDGRMHGQEYVARNPKRLDRHPGSFSINLKSGKWADFATGDRGGDPISLAAYLFDLHQAEAARRLADMLGVRP